MKCIYCNNEENLTVSDIIIVVWKILYPTFSQSQNLFKLDIKSSDLRAIKSY